MNKHPALRREEIYANRFHHSMALRGTVSRAFSIDMFGIKAVWAVVAVTAMLERRDLRSAVLTDKRFLAGNEDDRKKGNG